MATINYLNGVWFVQGPASSMAVVGGQVQVGRLGGCGAAVVPVGCADLGTYPTLDAARAAHPEARIGVDEHGRTRRDRRAEGLSW